MSSAGRSAWGRSGRVLPGPRARLAAVATGLGLLMLQSGALADGTILKVSPNPLTVGEVMTLEANLPPVEPSPDPMAPPAPDPGTFRYDWYLDPDGLPDQVGIGLTKIQPTVKPDPGSTTEQTLRLVVVNPGTDPSEIDDVIVDDSGYQAQPVGYRPEITLEASDTGTQTRTGDTVTFTVSASDKDGPTDVDESTWRWSIDGHDIPEAHGQTTLTRSFSTPGDYDLAVSVKDRAGRMTAFKKKVRISESPPVAAFVFSPSEPTTADAVVFDGRGSSDPDGTKLRYAWSIDGNDSFTDGDAETLTRRFDTDGEHTVALRVKDAGNNEDVITKTFTVRAAPAPPAPNEAPKASMTVTPRDPAVGQTVTLTSTASDSDGRIGRVQWDLDNNGKFNDGGTVTTTSFSTPGNHVVALKVFDNDGASATAFETVTVKEPVQTTQPPANRTLNPFPVVRIRGVILRRGVRVQILSVRAAHGVSVTVRCRGRGCPRRTASARITKGSGVRVKAFERTLRPGIVLEVRVTRPGWVGKYTKFAIRKRSAPRRTDLCVGPVSTRPVKCEG